MTPNTKMLLPEGADKATHMEALERFKSGTLRFVRLPEIVWPRVKSGTLLAWEYFSAEEKKRIRQLRQWARNGDKRALLRYLNTSRQAARQSGRLVDRPGYEYALRVCTARGWINPMSEIREGGARRG